MLDIKLTIAGLLDDAFKDGNADLRNALLNKMDVVARMIAQENYQGARNKLANDLLTKMDGFPEAGGDPQNDWIVDPDARIELYHKVQELIEALEELLDGGLPKVSSTQEAIPDKFHLFQNYPNPFNPVTTIQYQLPEGEWVTLKIYDVLGQSIRTLIDQYQPAGYYSVRWNGRDDDSRMVSSGLHFYRLQAGEDVAIRKMLFLK